MGDSPVSKEKGEKKLAEKENTKREAYLTRLDEEFKNRYTEADEDYKRVWNTNSQPPPILLDFDKMCEKNRDYYKSSHNHRRVAPFYYRGDRRNRYSRWE